MLCSCLRHGAYFNGTCKVFAHLLIILLGHDWLVFCQINDDALDSIHNGVLAQKTPLSSN